MAALTSPGVAPSRRRERAIVVALAITLTTILTYPTIPQLLTSGRLDTGDGRFSIWNVAWVAHALLTSPRHLFDANIFFPHPATLTYSELNLLAGVLATPVYALTRNAIAAHNSAVAAALLIAFLAMWVLTRRLTGSSAAGVIAATGYTFCAYTSAHTAEIQLLMIFGFPLVMLAFHRLATHQRWQDGVLLGAALAATALACGYYGVFAAAVVSVASVIWAERTARYWSALAIAVVASVLFVAPVVVPYFALRAAASAVTRPDVAEIRYYSADWRAYFTSGTLLEQAWNGVLYRNTRIKEVLFPGFVVIGLAMIGVVHAIRQRDNDRRIVIGYLILSAVALWASLGPGFGAYDLLQTVFPGGSMLRAPARLGIVVTFALAVLAAFGYRAIDRRQGGRARLLSVALLTAVVAELWVPWPLQGMPPVPRAYKMLAELPRGGVVEFPFPYMSIDFHNHTKAMLRSTFNWQPLVNGYSDFIPEDFRAFAVPINAFPDPASFELMRKLQVRYVVFRMAEYRGEAHPRLLARFAPYEANLRRLTADQDVWLYEIVAWPPANPGS